MRAAAAAGSRAAFPRRRATRAEAFGVSGSALVFSLAAAFGLASPGVALAQAYLDWSPSARSLARAGVGAGFADGPDAAATDPAGLAFSPGTAFEAGFVLAARDAGFEPFGGDRVERDPHPDLHPAVYASHAISRRLVAGLAVHSPWGSSVEWRDPRTFDGRFQASRALLRSLVVSPVVALRASSRVGVAAGLRVVHADFALDRVEQDPALSALGGLGPIPLARTRLDVDGVDVGWTAGAHVQPVEGVAIGVQLRSRVDVETAGPVDFTVIAPEDLRAFVLPGQETTVGELLDARYVDQSARATFVLPRLAIAGVAWQPLERLRLGADLQWGDWSGVDGLAIGFADSALADTVPLRYQDAWSIRLAAEVRHRPDLLLRFGFAHEESPALVGSVVPPLPDSDRNAVSAGIGFPWRGATIDVGYRVTVFEDREGAAFPGSPDDPDGVYEAIEHRLAISATRTL